jgi:hypothetical protein
VLDPVEAGPGLEPDPAADEPEALVPAEVQDADDFHGDEVYPGRSESDEVCPAAGFAPEPDALKTDDPRSDDPPAGDPVAEELPAEEPAAEEPAAGEPAEEEPVVGDTLAVGVHVGGV